MASAKQAMSSWGNGLGYIYVADDDGNLIKEKVYNNDSFGIEQARAEAIRNIPFSQNVSAVGSFQITVRSGTGDVTDVTVGGINQLSANVVHTGETATSLAVLLVTNINAFTSTGINYTATSSGDTVTLYADSSAGSTANAHTINVAVSAGTVTTVNTDPSGGSSTGAVTSRNAIHLDADFDAQACSGATAAVSTAIGANAVDVSSEVIPNVLNGSIDVNSATIASGVATYTRKTLYSILKVSAQTGSSDDLDTISRNNVPDGDFLLVIQGTTGHTITLKHGTDNLTLSSATDYIINNVNTSLLLRWDNTAAKWTEVTTRTSAITDATLRADGISIGKSGTKSYTVGSGGGTDTHVPGTDAGKVYINGNSVMLSSSYTFEFGGSPIDGEPVFVIYDPVSNVNGNTVTIGGVQLTTKEAQGGAALIAYYVSSAWKAVLLLDTSYAYIDDDKIPTNEIKTTSLELQAGLAAGSYTLVSLTVDAQGVMTAVSSGSATTGTALSGLLWVDPGGDDSTAVKGDIRLPWLTITTALTAASAGDTIMLAPGTYAADRSIFKDQVDINFMQGAKVVYTGSSGAVIQDSGSAVLRVKVTGYPWIEHAGTGSNKNAILLSGTGAHEIEFVNAEFTGAVTTKLFVINNSNAEVRFKNCLFRQQSNVSIGSFTAFSKISVENCWFVNENGGGSANGIELAADSPVFDGARFFITNTSAFCLVAAAGRTIIQYGNIYSNVASSGVISNLVAGGSLIVDGDVEFYS